MAMRATLRLGLAALLLLVVAPAGAQGTAPAVKPAAKPTPEAGVEQLDRFLQKAIADLGNRTVCLAEDAPVPAIRAQVIAQLKAMNVGDAASPEQTLTALLTRFPCPFSPQRPELRPAAAKDVEGVWLFPSASQPYRFGPKSHNQPPSPAVAVKCEIIGYYPGGELRSGMMTGEKPCVFQSAADLEPARTSPRVANWSLLRAGRLAITQTGLKDYRDEWDVFVVTTPFEVHDMALKPGDLLTYLRRSQGNDLNEATEFRHLQRLP